MFSPWVANVRRPTAYRMQLAHTFSQEGRKIFGSRWNGVYVIGSTASGMASHIKDVDVFPLVDDIMDGDLERWRQIDDFVTKLEKKTGVFVEIWKCHFEPRKGDPPRYTTDDLARIGPENIISSEAVLIDSGLEYLPARIDRPERRQKYERIRVEELRGDDKNSQKARIKYEINQRKRRIALIDLLSRELFGLNLGTLEQAVAAFVIFHNTVPMRYGIYNRFEFLLSHEPDIARFVGGVHDNCVMIDFLYQLSGAIKEDNSLRQRLIEFNVRMKDLDFEGVPKFLVSDSRFLLGERKTGN